MRPRCEVLVIGGGPAGIATAIALQLLGVHVVVAERTRYETPRSGEWLQGTSEPLLKQLGLWDQFSAEHASASAPVHSYWGEQATNHTAKSLEPRGWFVERPKFDATLALAAEAAGATVYCNLKTCDVTRVRRGWIITLASNGVREQIKARYIVDATGRAAWMARRVGAQAHALDNLVALIGTYSRAPSERTLLIESAREGWWYSVPLSPTGALCAYLTDRDLWSSVSADQFYRTQLKKTDWTLARVANLGEASLRTVAANTYGLDHCAGDGWLAVGDAAFAVDPLSGSGITRALESALRAAKAIGDSFGGSQDALVNYERDSQAQFAALLQARQYYYGLEQRWGSSLFWARRQNNSGRDVELTTSYMHDSSEKHSLSPSHELAVHKPLTTNV